MDLSDTVPSLVDVLDRPPPGEEAAAAADEAARRAAEAAAAEARARAAADRAAAAAAAVQAERSRPDWHPLAEPPLGSGGRGGDGGGVQLRAHSSGARPATSDAQPPVQAALADAPLRGDSCFSLLDDDDDEEGQSPTLAAGTRLRAFRSPKLGPRASPTPAVASSQPGAHLDMEPLTLSTAAMHVSPLPEQAEPAPPPVPVAAPPAAAPTYDDPLRAAAAEAEARTAAAARAAAQAPPLPMLLADASMGVGGPLAFPMVAHPHGHGHGHGQARAPPPKRRARRADVALRELLKVCAARGEERYDARSRVALRRVARHLRLTKADVTALEAEIGAALPLISLWPSVLKPTAPAASANSSSSELGELGTGDGDGEGGAAPEAGAPPPQWVGTDWLIAPLDAARADPEGNSTMDEATYNRNYKVAAAAAAGAGLLALTGGLAAPAILAGAATMLPAGAVAMGGGAGFVAGAAITGGFSVAGGSVAASSMAKRTAPLREFTFTPVVNDADGQPALQHARLAVTLCVSGWLTDPEDFVRPWEPLSGLDAERIAVVWETAELLKLGAALKAAVGDIGVAELVKHGAMHTAVQGLLAAVALPATVLTAASFIDNSWARCLDRADQAATLLAVALAEGAWYHRRPVTLLGYSLGARIVFGAMQRLAAQGLSGIVETVVLFGAPITAVPAEWDAVRQVTAGRLVNVFSENDWMLGLAYRASALSAGVAGLKAVAAEGVENIDVSHLVKGHTQYPTMLPQLLRLISQAAVRRGSNQAMPLPPA